MHTKRSNKHTFTSLVPLRCDELKYSFTRGSCGSLVTNSLYNDEPFKLCRLRQSFPMRDISEELNGNHFVFFFCIFVLKVFYLKNFKYRPFCGFAAVTVRSSHSLALKRKKGQNIRPRASGFCVYKFNLSGIIQLLWNFQSR